MGEVINEQNNIFFFPDVDKKFVADIGSQITIGDLHSNPIKLLFVLLKHGIAEGITMDDYQKLVQINQASNAQLTKEDLENFDAIIAKLQFKKTCLLRLIGDELADRGSNDYFVLAILNRLYQEKVPVEILLSNHGIEFVAAVESKAEKLVPKMLIMQHAQSLFNLNSLIEKGLVDRGKINNIYQSAYSHFLKIISYSLNNNEDEITIYSHAPSGVNSIRGLATLFKVTYDDATPLKLAATIDQINDEFKKHVTNNTIYQLCNPDVLSKAYMYESQGPDPEKNPVDFVIWNRMHNKCELPEMVNNYKIFFVHGHDMKKAYKPNVLNLDNNLGKPGLNFGPYTALYSHDHQLRHCYPIPTPAPWVGRLFPNVTRVDNNFSSVGLHQ